MCLDFAYILAGKDIFASALAVKKAVVMEGVRSSSTVGPTQCHTPGGAQRQLRALLPAQGGSTLAVTIQADITRTA